RGDRPRDRRGAHRRGPACPARARPVHRELTTMASTLTTRPDVDLLDPQLHVGDPHPAYAWMRRHEPIYRDRNGVWCVARMEHVRHVERHAADFVSSRGYRSVWFPDETAMIARDDPGHQQQRKLVSDMFTPRAVGA